MTRTEDVVQALLSIRCGAACTEEELHALAVDADVEMARALIVGSEELLLGFADFRGFTAAQGFDHVIDVV